MCYEHPEKHPYISEKEKLFLKNKTFDYLEVERKNLPSIPWKSIITNVPVVVLLVCTVSVALKRN